MINWLISLIWWDYNKKQIDAIMPKITEINYLFWEYDKLSDDELKAKTGEFKKRLQDWETVDDILTEAFAVVKQACKRLVWTTVKVKGQELVWNMIPYDVQLIWWIILHQWKIAEMKTWEWKTLVAVAPVYLNALTGKWVHVVTVNDYLASRDSEWMAHVYTWLGLTVWSVVKSTPLQNRREEYWKDITYVENTELWFDYLRDNLVKSMKERSLTWRPLNYAIVDEIDSILIDEARTPLIISQPREEPTEKYTYYAQVVNFLTPCSWKKKVSKWFIQEILNDEYWKEQEEDWDYYIDEKTKTAQLSWRWIARLEEILKVENIYKDMWYEEIHHIENALKAKAVYIKDKDYIVSNWEVLIVDEHTWRTMPWRRFSEWLHQAIEAKENVKIQRESQTIATITYQNFFKQYDKLCWMTWTASTEWEEFNKIYELDVVIVPTNKPVLRVDLNDKVYFNQHTKWKFVKDYIKFYHEIWQPILIGTADIATSEYVSKLLDKEAIVHYVLNAKFHEQEANIVSNAWKYRSVVVATNMAWRWTDIKLEDWLNEKMAENYVKFFDKSLRSWVSAVWKVYSELEYNLILNALKEKYDLSDKALKEVEKWVKIWEHHFSVQFAKKRKENSDYYARFVFTPEALDSTKEQIEKDLFFGLFILWTEKHESRRIDNQLRWRSWRQWDPWVSVFFVALDDSLMRKMWGEKFQSLASVLLSKNDLENLELTQKQFSKNIIRAQKEIEWWYFWIRKHLFDYDSVVDKQRRKIYRVRDEILASEDDEELQNKYVSSFKDEFLTEAKNIIITQITNAEITGQSVWDVLVVLNKEYWLNITTPEYQEYSKLDYETLKAVLLERLDNYFWNVFETLKTWVLFNIFREVHLHFLDKLWIDHIDEMQNLREKVWLMSYAQLDPLVIYKKESFEKFQELLANIINSTSSYLLKIDFEAIASQQIAAQLVQDQDNQEKVIEILSSASRDLWSRKRPVTVAKKEINDAREKIFESDDDWVEVFEADDVPVREVYKPQWKVRPNDPCPCGSWKKYKKCHGKDE